MMGKALKTAAEIATLTNAELSKHELLQRYEYRGHHARRR
jgi:hypothetical protein